jgi:hypothetical protein
MPHQHAPSVKRRASPLAGAGGFLAETLARRQNATTLYMNAVESLNRDVVPPTKLAHS